MRRSRRTGTLRPSSMTSPPPGPPARLARWHAGSRRRRRDGLLLGPARLDVRVVQVERGALGPDARYRREVVPRRRAGRRPLQRVAPAPGIVHGDLLAVARRLVHVVEEEER